MLGEIRGQAQPHHTFVERVSSSDGGSGARSALPRRRGVRLLALGAGRLEVADALRARYESPGTGHPAESRIPQPGFPTTARLRPLTLVPENPTDFDNQLLEPSPRTRRDFLKERRIVESREANGMAQTLEEMPSPRNPLFETEEVN